MFKPTLLVSTLLASFMCFSCGGNKAGGEKENQEGKEETVKFEKPADCGAYKMPYVRYDSKDAEKGGAAKHETAYDFDFHKTASEASNQEYIALNTTDDFISWKIDNLANGVTVRFTLPDNKSGESIGQKSAIDFFVNNEKITTVQLDSRWAWQYFLSDKPTNDSIRWEVSTPQMHVTDNPAMRFDEVHFLLKDFIKPGDVVTIRKSSNDELECGIDFIEIEDVPAPITKPGNALSVKDFGAKGDGKTDDLPAFYACIKEALKQNRIVYIPEGTYALDDLFTLFEDNINLQGAGMWYTNLYFSNNGNRKGAICANASNLRVADMHINGINTLRQIDKRTYRDYKGLWGNYGENSVVENVWVEHFECGMWTAGYAHTPPVKAPTNNLRVTNVRFRNHYADGVNFALGTSNSVFEHSDIRNCGDDGIASWSQTETGHTEKCNQGNTFRYNTIELGWRAGGIGIFGGGGHKIHNCFVGEHALSAGIRFTADFPGCALDTNPDNKMRVYDCVIYKCGTTYDLFGDRFGSIDIHGGKWNPEATIGHPLKNIEFENIQIVDSQTDGIQLWGGNMENITFKNVTINGIGKGYAVNGVTAPSYDINARDAWGGPGSANFTNVTANKVNNENDAYQLTFNK